MTQHVCRKWWHVSSDGAHGSQAVQPTNTSFIKVQLRRTGLAVTSRPIPGPSKKQLRFCSVPIRKCLHGRAGVQCLLGHVLVVERDVTAQGLLPVLAGPAVGRAQQVGDAPIEALGPAVGLPVARRRQAVRDTQFLAPAIECMLPARCPRPAPERPVRELGAVVGQERLDPTRRGRGQGVQEGARSARSCRASAPPKPSGWLGRWPRTGCGAGPRPPRVEINYSISY